LQNTFGLILKNNVFLRKNKTMQQFKYWDEFPSAVTICDTEATVVYMNNKAATTFEKWGGKELLGKSLHGCHNPKSIEKINEILATGEPNSYTISKNGQKKIIHQSPWYLNGEIAGIVEISIVIPEEMMHFER
jgi:transcriptional regulator with PAS, ATPase and Fis domain